MESCILASKNLVKVKEYYGRNTKFLEGWSPASKVVGDWCLVLIQSSIRFGGQAYR